MGLMGHDPQLLYALLNEYFFGVFLAFLQVVTVFALKASICYSFIKGDGLVL